MPFFRPKASVSFPLIVNFCPLGILKDWFVPSSNVKTTELGGETCQTLPVTVSTFVINLHAWLKLVDVEQPAIDGDGCAVRNIEKVPQRTILHLNDQVVAGDIHNLSALNRDLFGGRAVFYCFGAFHLRNRWQGEGKTKRASRQQTLQDRL